MNSATACLDIARRPQARRLAMILIAVVGEATPAIAAPPKLGVDVQYEENPGGYHIIVNGVFKGSPADRAGIAQGDEIVAINDQPITSPDALGVLVRSGAPFTLKIINPLTGKTKFVALSSAPNAGGTGVPDPAGFGGPTSPPLGAATNGVVLYRLTNEALGAASSLASDPRGRLSMQPSGPAPAQRWRLQPSGQGRYRLTNDSLGADWALTATPAAGRATMEQITPGAGRQVWRVSSASGAYQLVQSSAGVDYGLGLPPTSGGSPAPGVFVLGSQPGQRWRLAPFDAAPAATPLVGAWEEYRTATNRASGLQIVVQPDYRFVQFNGGVEVGGGELTFADNRLTLAHADGTRETLGYAVSPGRIDFFSSTGEPEVFYWQLASGGAAPPAPPGFADLSERRISRKIVPNQLLPPANVQFKNSSDEEIWVLVRDLRDDAGSMQLMIPPGGSQTVQLERDPGATIREVWEVPLRDGSAQLDDRVFQIPPAQFYRVSVYLNEVTSLVIDATDRGRGKVSDVHHSPKSLGAFPIPPGAAQPDGVIDAYAKARRAKNPGAVDVIDPNDWVESELPPTDPIKQILRRQR